MEVSKASNFCAMCARGEENDMMLADIETLHQAQVALTLTSPGFDEKFTTAIVLGNCIHFTWTMGRGDGDRDEAEEACSSVCVVVCAWCSVLVIRGEGGESWRCAYRW